MVKRGVKKKSVVKKNSSFKSSRIKSESIPLKKSSSNEKISVSDLKQSYSLYSSKTPIIVALSIIFAALLIGGGYVLYNNYMTDFSFSGFFSNIKFDFWSKNDDVDKNNNIDDLIIENDNTTNDIIEEPVKLSCGEKANLMIPSKITLTRSTGAGTEWMFNPLQNRMNNYTNGQVLVPERNIFYVRISNGQYIAREGMTNADYYKYRSRDLIFDFNPIFVNTNDDEYMVEVKGVPMIAKPFLVKFNQVSNCKHVD